MSRTPVPIASGPRLTPTQLAQRWPGVTTKLLAQWRYLKVGPDYIKVEKHVFYPLSAIEAYEQRNTVACGGAA